MPELELDRVTYDPIGEIDADAVVYDEKPPSTMDRVNRFLERTSKNFGFSGVEGAYSGEMPAINPKEIAEGILRAGVELPLFPVRATGEMAAASAGRPMAIEGVSAEGGDTDVALQEKVSTEFQGGLDTLKEMAFGAEPGAVALEEGLSVPFAVIGAGPQAFGEYVLKQTRDPLIAKAAEYGLLIGMFKVGRVGGKAYKSRTEILESIKEKVREARKSKPVEEGPRTVPVDEVVFDAPEPPPSGTPELDTLNRDVERIVSGQAEHEQISRDIMAPIVEFAERQEAERQAILKEMEGERPPAEPAPPSPPPTPEAPKPAGATTSAQSPKGKESKGLFAGKIHLTPEEYRDLHVWENGLAGFFTRDPRGTRWDKQVQSLISKGILPEGADLDTLADYIKSYKKAKSKGVSAKEFKSGYGRETEKAGEEWEKKQQEQYRPTRFEGNQLRVGDTFNYRGEKFEVVEERENGVLIQDGQLEYIDNDGYFFADHGKIVREGKEINVSEAGKFMPAEKVQYDREGQGKIPGVKEDFRLITEEGQRIEAPSLRTGLQDILPETEKAYRNVGMADQSFSPEKGFRREPEVEGETASEPIRRSEIVDFLREKFDIPIRYGKVTGPKGALGIFKIKPEVIRSKFANDIETISHEVGHALHKYLWPDARNRKGLKGTPFKAYEDELLPIATKARAGQDPLPEGFAEFVRRYVTNPKQAQEVAPRFFAWFEATLGEKAPEAREILLQTRRDYDRWLKQPAAARILSQISVGDKTEKPRSMDRLYTATIDELYPLKKIIDQMKGEGELPAPDNPYELARLMAGWQGKAHSFLEHQPFRFSNYEFEGKPLREILDPIKGELDDFRIYAVAKRTVELSKRGKPVETGVLLADAHKALDIYGKRFDKPWEELQQYQNALLKYAVESGLLSARTVVEMRKANLDYIPFYRVFEERQESAGIGKGFEAPGVFKRIKGSHRDIVDPLESVIKNTYAIINAAEKNAVGQSLARLANAKEGMGKFVEKIPPDRLPVTLYERELLEILRKYGKWSESSQFTETGKTIRETIKTEGAPDVPEGDRGVRLMEDRAIEALTSRGWTKNEAEIILRKIKGAKNEEFRNKIIERTIERTAVRSTVRGYGVEIPEGVVNIFRPAPWAPKGNVITVMEKGKPAYYQVAPDLYRTFEALDKESANALIRVLAIPARLLRTGATLSPEFMMRNPLRDQFTAFVYSKYGFVPGFDLMRGAAHLIRQDEVYKQFIISGGQHAALVSMDREYLQTNLKNLMDSPNMVGQVKNIIRHPIDSLRLLSELGEEGTRLGEFGRALAKEGTSKAGIQAAGLAARDVTLDFQRAGAKVKAVNLIVAFWNANVQGMDKLVREMRDNPVPTTVKALGAITLPSLLLVAANHDDPRWGDVPRWQKDLFWIVFTKDTVWRIPKPFELGIIFGSIPERFAEYALDRDPNAIKGLMATVGRGAMPGFIPTFMNPFIENWANKNSFTDRPLVPRVREQLAPRFQYQPYTTEVAKMLGEYISKLPGLGDSSVASPVKIENLIRGWTGGLGMTVLKGADNALRLARINPRRIDPTPTLADMPFIKGFVVRYPSSDSEQVQRFYESYRIANQALATAQLLLKKEQDVETAKEVLRSVNLTKIDKINKALTNAHRAIELIYANPQMMPDEKRKMIDTIYIQMNDVAREGNRILNSQGGK